MLPQKLYVQVSCLSTILILFCRTPCCDSAAVQQRLGRAVSATNDSIEECGRQIAGDIDFDGTIERELGEFPWMARIVNSKKYFYCPGVIISPTAVLAKADCIFRQRPADLSVVLGEFKTTMSHDKDEAIVTSAVESIIFPGGYQLGLQSKIAIVRLRTKVVFSDYIRPICLPPADLNLNGKVVTVADRNLRLAFNLKTTNGMMKKRVKVWNPQQCQAQSSFYSATEEICYGFDDISNDNYRGEVMMYQDVTTGRWMIVGIGYWVHFWRLNHTSHSYLLGFTRISHYDKWIRSLDAFVNHPTRSLASTSTQSKISPPSFPSSPPTTAFPDDHDYFNDCDK